MHNYYNNFYILKVAKWLTPEVQKFLEKIDETGCFYTHRWGDSNIYAIIVKAFTNKEERHKFTEFKYSHGSHKYCNKPSSIDQWN